MKDLTKGRPIKLIVLFALPILFGNIFQQTYNLADIMIIGQNLGNNSIAAVGATAPVVSLMFNII
ncbi:MAG: MATE family efflux transporter, partial [Ruminococcaceae bacterium]|nr:MATE family efflux transporter [Oscillospiraceae bacterium]